MPRPRKWKKVCGLPRWRRFMPMGEELPGTEPLWVTVEEYETLRLMDYEGLTQEECARQMEVARTTVQSLYGSVRRKLAQALVEGRTLEIGGGHFRLCPNRLPEGPCCGGRHRKNEGEDPAEGSEGEENKNGRAEESSQYEKRAP